jgi:hypothetical protein
MCPEAASASRTGDADCWCDNAAFKSRAEKTGARWAGLIWSPWNGFDLADQQRHPVYFGPLCRNAEPAGHHPPAHGLQPPPRATVTSRRFHRSLKEEEVWLNKYENFDHAEQCIARWIKECNHYRPHHGLHGQTPHESSARFSPTITFSPALRV